MSIKFTYGIISDPVQVSHVTTKSTSLDGFNNALLIVAVLKDGSEVILENFDRELMDSINKTLFPVPESKLEQLKGHANQAKDKLFSFSRTAKNKIKEFTQPSNPETVLKDLLSKMSDDLNKMLKSGEQNDDVEVRYDIEYYENINQNRQVLSIDKDTMIDLVKGVYKFNLLDAIIVLLDSKHTSFNIDRFNHVYDNISEHTTIGDFLISYLTDK